MKTGESLLAGESTYDGWLATDDLPEIDSHWHELCHRLTPGQGHYAEVRRLEGLWPNHASLDHEIDTLHELYAMPKRPSK